MLRSVVEIVTAPETPEGAGAVVKRALPFGYTNVVDPFVLLDEFFVRPPAAFPDHPHRGFEIVTYMLDGSFRHRDSMGNDSTIQAGGLQRITAGAGIVHAELPMTQGLNHGLQLWINLPRALKGIPADYQGVPGEHLPESSGDGYRVRTVVGPGSPVKLQTRVLYFDVSLQPQARWESDVPAGLAAVLYAFQGSDGRVGESQAEVGAGALAILGEGDSVRVLAGREPLRFALIAGQPHGEPIRMRGPYVD
jgi:redox-sensitive bicupin YhaK (pirin superfamily)